MSIFGRFGRLMRLRTVPRDVFQKLDYLIDRTHAAQDAQDNARRRLDELTAGVQMSRELIRQVTDLQDDLVRRELADQRIQQLATGLETLTMRTDRLSLDNDRLALGADRLAWSTDRLESLERAWVGQLATARRELLSVPSHLADPDTGARVRRALSLLRPAAAVGIEKTRIGRDFDGGYVCLDAFNDIDAALSMGIKDDASWDLNIAEKGIPVYQFDPTISKSPEEHANLHFEPTYVGSIDGPGLTSLTRVLATRVEAGQTRLLLKIDIEGAEWLALDEVDPALLSHVSQIVCEFHHLDRLAEMDFNALAHRVFTKLAVDFFVCHVHGNNCGDMAVVGNVPVPESLEVTFANRSRFESQATDELFPTPLDQPNQEGRADLFLGRFQF